MQAIHVVIVELTNQSLPNALMGVDFEQKTSKTKTSFTFIYKQSMLTNNGVAQ